MAEPQRAPEGSVQLIRSPALPCPAAGLVVCVAEEMPGAWTEDQALLNGLRWSGMGGRCHSLFWQITEVSGLCGSDSLRFRGRVRDIESGLLAHLNEDCSRLCGCRGQIAAGGLCFSKVQGFILLKI